MAWHIGDILDRIAAWGDPERPALIHGTRRLSWRAFDRRSNAIARNLHARGVPIGAKVAFYMRNGPEYLELLAATMKGRFTHVNINYRYRAQELAYILDNSDAAVVVYAAEFRPLVEEVRGQCPQVALWVEIGEERLPLNTARYDDLLAGDETPLSLPRDGDDVVLVYTGGTTGMPKGVIWTHDIMVRAMFSGLSMDGGGSPETMDQLIAFVGAQGATIVQLPTAPLMHLTGMATALLTLLGGGTVVTVPDADGLDPEAIWDAVARERVTNMAIVGDTFAKPLLRALDAAPGARDLSSLALVISSGVTWSAPVKAGLLQHLPGATFLDAIASTEAPAIAATVSNSATGPGTTQDFQVGPDCRVLDAEGRAVAPGAIGFLARTGNLPLGYYKDPEKTAATFRTIDGARFVLTGDMSRVEADGRITLLGRSSACINTGGEKVFAEEVEEALKEHPAVDDASVIGLPDERWGQAVVAIVALREGAAAPEAELRDHVRQRLANYKVPKRVLVKDGLERFPNGKPNYTRMREYAAAALEKETAA